MLAHYPLSIYTNFILLAFCKTSLTSKHPTKFCMRAGIAWSVQRLTTIAPSEPPIPAGPRDFSFPQNIQTGSGVQLASHSMGTGAIS